MPTQARTGYCSDNGWEHAQRRLRALERVYDPGSTRRLAALEVGPGWRCLEVGAGGGSITRWLCSRVAPNGRVLAVDLDTRFVADLRASNLDVAQLDVTVEDLPRGAYDLVHARAVLEHIPARADVLAKLVAALAPGGWLLLEEPDTELTTASAGGLHADVLARIETVLTGAGVDRSWARDLPCHLHEAGLVDIGAETEAPRSAGGSPGAELLQLTGRQLREPAIEAGATPEQLDDWDRALSDPHTWFPGYVIVAAWGRRP